MSRHRYVGREQCPHCDGYGVQVDRDALPLCESCGGAGRLDPATKAAAGLRLYTCAELSDELVRRGWLFGRVTVDGLPPLRAIVEPARDALLRARVLDATPGKGSAS